MLLFWQCLVCFFQVHVLVVSAAIQQSVSRGKKIQWHGGICLIRYRAEKNVYVTSGASVAAAEGNRKTVNVQLNASV